MTPSLSAGEAAGGAAAEAAGGAAASPATPAAASAPGTPWEGPAPDAVAWLLVNWHNRHPLARRITTQDVHTVGAVALPFLAQPLPKEPSLDAPGTNTPVEPPARPPRRWPWQRSKATTQGPRRAWSDVFIPGLKPDAVAAMAVDNGFTSAPDDLPLRRVEISNSELESGGVTQSGAWPMELVLLSAAIDAGPARNRVLVGRRDRVLGRRALDPLRLGAVAAVAVLLLALITWALWPRASKESTEAASAAASAASAASSAASTASGPAATAANASASAASAPLASASEASAADAGEGAAVPAAGASEAASAPSGEASAAASAPAASSAAPAASGGGVPVLGKPRTNGGRPSLQSGVERMREEQAQKDAGPGASTPKQAADSTKPATATSPKDGQKDAAREGQNLAQKDGTSDSAKDSGSKPATPATEAERRLAVDDAGLSKLITPGASGSKLVALVGLPQKTKPEAEAQLVRMQDMVGQTLRGGTQTVNGAVFQTKEGWRAAVWPFASREEAQLINATLLARGMRARAVDF
ncbi:hypothetical protein OU995_25955 [Roseateles sp. SL47]|uniref:hypothetical protein n=1 Tax=Roseateles sp. SL47 TaxID=2995138 RepID=UPI002270AC1D|nr:hypothetical protein [Roseateles sp. SL47]WAC72916.1 hypothetical protein OU995_25955 [Roseateles sp. SL47]